MRLFFITLAVAFTLVGCGKEQAATSESGSSPKTTAGQAATAKPEATPKAKAAPKPVAKAAAKAAALKGPATIDGAKATLSKFLAADADRAALSLGLKPSSADYRAVFTTEAVAKAAEAKYEGLWAQVSRRPIAPKAGQTELLLWKATTDELKAGAGDAGQFPGGYKQVLEHLKPGLTVFRWKFVEPGKKIGMAFDGLYNLDGRWVFMPKPWRVVPRQ